LKNTNPFLDSDQGKSVAITGSKFGFRPSYAVGIYHPTKSLFFDTIAAAVITEMEAAAYRGSGKPSGPKTFRWDLQQKIDARITKQEEIAAKQAKRLGNG